MPLHLAAVQLYFIVAFFPAVPDNYCPVTLVILEGFATATAIRDTPVSLSVLGNKFLPVIGGCVGLVHLQLFTVVVGGGVKSGGLGGTNVVAPNYQRTT